MQLFDWDLFSFISDVRGNVGVIVWWVKVRKIAWNVFAISWEVFYLCPLKWIPLQLIFLLPFFWHLVNRQNKRMSCSARSSILFNCLLSNSNIAACWVLRKLDFARLYSAYDACCMPLGFPSWIQSRRFWVALEWAAFTFEFQYGFVKDLNFEWGELIPSQYSTLWYNV